MHVTGQGAYKNKEAFLNRFGTPIDAFPVRRLYTRQFESIGG